MHQREWVREVKRGVMYRAGLFMLSTGDGSDEWRKDVVKFTKIN